MTTRTRISAVDLAYCPFSLCASCTAEITFKKRGRPKQSIFI